MKTIVQFFVLKVLIASFLVLLPGVCRAQSAEFASTAVNAPNQSDSSTGSIFMVNPEPLSMDEQIDYGMRSSDPEFADHEAEGWGEVLFMILGPPVIFIGLPIAVAALLSL